MNAISWPRLAILAGLLVGVIVFRFSLTSDPEPVAASGEGETIVFGGENYTPLVERSWDGTLPEAVPVAEKIEIAKENQSPEWKNREIYKNMKGLHVYELPEEFEPKPREYPDVVIPFEIVGDDNDENK